MRKSALLLALMAAAVFSTAAFAAEGFSRDTIKRMGVFLSNFTELGMYNLPDAQKLSAEEYVMFGVMHNWVNNPKLWKNDKDSTATIGQQSIETSIQRYFGKKFAAHCPSADYGIDYDEKAKRYRIQAADGEMRIYARVESVTQNADGTLTMAGTLYNAEDEKDTYGPFTARAKPHKWNKRDTWALLSLECPMMTAQ